MSVACAKWIPQSRALSWFSRSGLLRLQSRVCAFLNVRLRLTDARFTHITRSTDTQLDAACPSKIGSEGNQPSLATVTYHIHCTYVLSRKELAMTTINKCVMPRCFNAVQRASSHSSLSPIMALCVESNLSSPNRILQQGLSARHRPNVAVLHTVVQGLTSLGGCRGAWSHAGSRRLHFTNPRSSLRISRATSSAHIRELALQPIWRLYRG